MQKVGVGWNRFFHPISKGDEGFKQRQKKNSEASKGRQPRTIQKGRGGGYIRRARGGCSRRCGRGCSRRSAAEGRRPRRRRRRIKSENRSQRFGNNNLII